MQSYWNLSWLAVSSLIIYRDTIFLNKIVPLSPPVGMELKIKKVKLTSRLFFNDHFREN